MFFIARNGLRRTRQPLETAVAVLVGVLNQIFCLAFDADRLEIVEIVVRKRILHSVAAMNQGHKETPHLNDDKQMRRKVIYFLLF